MKKIFMNEKMLYSYRLYFTGVVTIAIGALLLWTHYNGGVPNHHLLHRKELPAISNWWSGLLIPLVTWFLLSRIQKRIIQAKDGESPIEQISGNIILGFIGALCYSASMAIFFAYDLGYITGYMLLGLLLIAFFYPVYRSEFILGFILGMTFTFGAFIPAAIACIFSLLGLLIYRFFRPALFYIFSRIFSSVAPKKEGRSDR